MTAPVDTPATENAAVETAPVETATAEKAPVDLSAFNAAVDTRLAASTDEDVESATAAVRDAYHALERGAKTTARKALEDRATAAIMASEVAAAQTLIRLKDEMTKPLPSAGGGTVSRAPKNPTEDVVNKIAAIQLGYSLAMLTANSATDIDADWQNQIATIATAEAQERAHAYAAWLEAKQEGDEPDASEVEKAAARISLGRAPKGQGRKPKAKTEEEAPATSPEPVTEPVAAPVTEPVAVATEASAVDQITAAAAE